MYIECESEYESEYNMYIEYESEYNMKVNIIYIDVIVRLVSITPGHVKLD